MAKQIAVGVLAHVDAGKTTLTESLLLISGAIRKAGRVDKRDSFLDTEPEDQYVPTSLYVLIISVKSFRLTCAGME